MATDDPHTSAPDPERFQAARDHMVARHIAARGIDDELVLDAMRQVPREHFVAHEMRTYAYTDSALPIGAGQTISQPYIVALMTAALQPQPGMRVLEIGTGSGYAAAVLAHCVARVYTVERHAALARVARERFDSLGYDNIVVRVGDGTLGWPEQAPFDAIVVAAGGPRVPESLREQLAVGGRLVIPVGADARGQELLCVRRLSEDEFEETSLAPVRFVPLIGRHGWDDPDDDANPGNPGNPGSDDPRGQSSGLAAAERDAGAGEDEPDELEDEAHDDLIGDRALSLSPGPFEARSVARVLRRGVQRFGDIDAVDLSPLLDRIGDARVVCLGESTHGTREFYRMRTAITKALVERRGFDFVAVEADWPDARRIDRFVRDLDVDCRRTWEAFSRFPRWMWRNHEVTELVDWLRDFNRRSHAAAPHRGVGFYGLDLYSLFTSITEVQDYLDVHDPALSEIARRCYGCLEPWQGSPARYGRDALINRSDHCEHQVNVMLQALLERREQLLAHDGARAERLFFDAELNARLIANAERYYRAAYMGAAAAWNLRDLHMFETLKLLLDHAGPRARAVVWAHNTHVGDARATEMEARGEHNLGQLCRIAFGDGAFLIGFGTHTGTVAAADEWDGHLRIKHLNASHPNSVERLCHNASGPRGRFMLPLRGGIADPQLRELFETPRLGRAVGVVYRPDIELHAHYLQTTLADQFDEWIWFDETRAVTPLSETRTIHHAEPETWPSGL